MTVEYDMFEGRVWKNLVSSKGNRNKNNSISISRQLSNKLTNQMPSSLKKYYNKSAIY